MSFVTGNKDDFSNIDIVTQHSQRCHIYVNTRAANHLTINQLTMVNFSELVVNRLKKINHG